MKISCPYCGNLFEETEAKCPHCDAPNEHRSSGKSGPPKTIEELQKWYELRKLPPYETTRFFIGMNVKEARAFGIYRDGNKVIVYKNKDNGQRAVRYQGTDEAYAVNEIYTKLKDEILHQKENNAARSGKLASGSPVTNAPVQKKQQNSNRKRKEPLIRWKTGRLGLPKLDGQLGCLLRFILFPFKVAAVIVALAFVWAIGDEIFVNPPTPGTYSYESTQYAFAENPDSVFHRNWFILDGEWSGPLEKEEVPQELRRRHNAKHYLISTGFSEEDPTELTQSQAYEDWLVAYADKESDYQVSTGYYNYEGNTYYHLEKDADSGWYTYGDSGWSAVSDIPPVLVHSYYASDYYSGGDYGDDAYYTDFADTDYYSAYNAQFESSGTSSSWSSSSSSSSSWDDDDDDWDWDWDSGDSWDSSDSDWDSDW